MKSLTKAAIMALAISTTAAPLMAQAQPRGDHREWRQDRGERYDRRDRHDRYDRRDHRPDRPDHRRPDYRGPSHGPRAYDPPRNYRPAPPVHRVDRWDRSNRNWWRGRPEFRDYRGMRSGYWYAPGYGYYRVDPRYASYRWRQGTYLPPAYRSYYVRDPAFYGLRPAPRGYRYVHANNDILLVAVATGLIASVLSGVY